MRVNTSIVVALAALLLSTPAARADDTDDNYLSSLDAFGLTPAALNVPNAAREIALGHTICIDFATSSESPDDMVTAMMRDLPNLTRYDVENLVTTAVVDYCGDVRRLPWS